MLLLAKIYVEDTVMKRCEESEKIHKDALALHFGAPQNFQNCVEVVRNGATGASNWRGSFPEEKAPHIFLRSTELTAAEQELLGKEFGAKLEQGLGGPPPGGFLRRFVCAKMCGCVCAWEPKGLEEGEGGTGGGQGGQ